MDNFAYVRKDVIRHVINLFTNEPFYRDERHLTVEWIITKHYSLVYGKNIIMDFKLTSDIDRAFRLVQAEIRELRGEKYWERQRRGGELSEEDYLDIIGMKSQINELQLKLFNDNDIKNDN